ncbi:MAG TPA: inositol-3-phosphate synthase [Candidatus Bathyarchaeia archaeon]
MGKIKVALAGVGNCASALIQGIQYYRKNPPAEDGLTTGLMHPSFGPYKVDDITFVAAFEVNKKKIGADLSKAIFTEPNSAPKISDVPDMDVTVKPGPILDGVAPHMREPFHVYSKSKTKPVDVAAELKDSGAEILVNYLPVGSEKGARFYAQAAVDAGCGFVNCIPEFIASTDSWAKKFEEHKLPIAGDDVKSQVGATIVHRSLVDLCLKRGVRVDESYQLNLGGDTDFLNMTVEERLHSKRISKTTAVASLIPYSVPTRIGPSDYVPHLKNKKICYIYLKGRGWGNIPLQIDLKLAVEDSPNSGGVVADVIRAVKIGLDRGIGGPLTSISSYSFKYPPVKIPDGLASQWVEDYIQGKRDR